MSRMRSSFSRPGAGLIHLSVSLLFLCMSAAAMGQMGTATPLSAEERQKAAVEREATSALPNYPQLVDITASTGLNFEHLTPPTEIFIVESMSGGVALIDYDRDGWRDIYFTNAQSVEMTLQGVKAHSALYQIGRAHV